MPAGAPEAQRRDPPGSCDRGFERAGRPRAQKGRRQALQIQRRRPVAPVLQGGHDRLARAARLRGQKLRRRRLRQVLVHTRGRRLSRRASTRHTRGPGRRLGRPSPAVFNLMVFPSEFRSAAIIASCDGWSNRRPARAPRQCTNTARPIKKKIYSRNASKEAGTTGKGGISTAQRSVKRFYRNRQNGPLLGAPLLSLSQPPSCISPIATRRPEACRHPFRK